jgi:phospholipid/cholesterol/gamma-HCH transport system substrate-binding protein
MQHLAHATGDIDRIADHVAAGRGTVGGLIYDPAIYENLRSIVGSVSRSRILRALIRLSLRHHGPAEAVPQPQKSGR